MLSTKLIPREPITMKQGSSFIPVPLCFQENEYTCGAACVQSLLARYGIYYKQSVLEKVLDSRPMVGTSVKRIQSFVASLGLTASFREDMKTEDLINIIDSDIAPILMIQAWSDDEIGYCNDWRNGHYIIACGYYEKGIYVMDPYTLGNYTYLPFEDLEERWHILDMSGTRYNKSALIIHHESCPVVYDPSKIKYLG